MAKISVDLTFEIEEFYGFLNPEHTICYAKVSWNGRKARDEIRRCKEENGELRLNKGLAITDSEIEQLIKLYQGGKKPVGGPVDFDEIFAASQGIMEKRKAGYTTEDGFIVIKRRNT